MEGTSSLHPGWANGMEARSLRTNGPDVFGLHNTIGLGGDGFFLARCSPLTVNCSSANGWVLGTTTKHVGFGYTPPHRVCSIEKATCGSTSHLICKKLAKGPVRPKPVLSGPSPFHAMWREPPFGQARLH